MPYRTAEGSLHDQSVEFSIGGPFTFLVRTRLRYAFQSFRVSSRAALTRCMHRLKCDVWFQKYIVAFLTSFPVRESSGENDPLSSFSDVSESVPPFDGVPFETYAMLVRMMTSRRKGTYAR